MIVGLTMTGNSIFTTPSLLDEVKEIRIMNGIYDYLFGSNNYKKQEMDWDYDTAFYAKFNGNLMAGNVDYAASLVSSIRIKRRKNEEHKWFTLYDIPITCNDDFSFELFDRYTQGSQDYDYAFVPVINHVEGYISKNSIHSEFNHYFILDKERMYPIIFNAELNFQLNKQISTVNTLGSKYPFVISNSMTQYKTGTLSFGLAHVVNCDIDVDDGYEYRENFEQWITNGKPKILKDWTGHMYMIQITDSISIDTKFWQLPTYNISFSEVGDPFDNVDMYMNNFIDVIPELSTSYPL